MNGCVVSVCLNLPALNSKGLIITNEATATLKFSNDACTIPLLSQESSWIVATDIDRTLIRGPKDVEEAGRGIRNLRNYGFRTILASSKTFSEMVLFYQVAGLPPSPFIFENGCGIGWPLAGLPPALRNRVTLKTDDYAAILLGSAVDIAHHALLNLRHRESMNFSLLGEMDLMDLATLTGLNLETAMLARQRLASVPVFWRDSQAKLEAFVTKLTAQGFRAVYGGIFLHVSSPCDKYLALVRMLDWLNWHRLSVKILACGDSENDRILLENADIGLLFSCTPDRSLINPPHHTLHSINGMQHVNLGKSSTLVSGAGPSIWLQAVKTALMEQTVRYSRQ